MALVTMTDAVDGGVASSSANNAIIDNVQDLDARLGPVLSSNTASARLGTLEARTTDTATSPGGIGNQQLANRFGTGVGTTTNVTTGTATAQLTDIRTRLTVVENKPTVYAYQTVSQTIQQAFVGITLGAVLTDTDTMWSAASPTRLTCVRAGVYNVSAMLSYNAGATANYDRRLGQIWKNGVALQGFAGGVPAFTVGTAANLGIRPIVLPTAPIVLSVGDYLELRGYSDQNAAGGWTTAVTSGYNSFIAATWLRA